MFQKIFRYQQIKKYDLINDIYGGRNQTQRHSNFCQFLL